MSQLCHIVYSIMIINMNIDWKNTNWYMQNPKVRLLLTWLHLWLRCRSQHPSLFVVKTDITPAIPSHFSKCTGSLTCPRCYYSQCFHPARSWCWRGRMISHESCPKVHVVTIIVTMGSSHLITMLVSHRRKAENLARLEHLSVEHAERWGSTMYQQRSRPECKI